MDPLSDVLSLLKPHIRGAAGFDMGQDWSVWFPAYDGIKCYAVVSGRCWLSMDSVADAVRLEAGDCFVLPQGRPFRLASDLDVPSIETSGCSPEGGIETFHGGGCCFIAGGHFSIASPQVDLLVRTLPSIIQIHDETNRAALRWALLRMRDELSEQQPGAGLMSEHLAHMVLIQALRTYVAQGPAEQERWLVALADRQIGASIKAVHADPARRWTLKGLAAEARMSRSGFAVRFKELVGQAPMTYVTYWRMLLAADRLTNSDDAVATIAQSLGYISENSFGIAFKRVTGSSPRKYSRTKQT